MKTNVLGVQYDNVTMAEALDTARALLQRPEASYCVTPNAEMAYEALHDESFRAILNEAAPSGRTSEASFSCAAPLFFVCVLIFWQRPKLWLLHQQTNHE